jgi:2-C-methyl-D-erythritol 4-phosphate cytidylyltransferase
MEALAILVAAGRGERMRASRPKAFLHLAGLSLLERAARAFERAPSVDAIVVVAPATEIASALALLRSVGKLKGVVAGGPRRQDSVFEGMKTAPPGFSGLVVVHDAARPLIGVALIESVMAVARETGAALPVLDLPDTVKRVRDGRVVETLDRSELRAAQTPQAFRFPLLLRAYEEAFRQGVVLTDEAMAVERLGEKVTALPGATQNRKITTPEDLAWAEGVLSGIAGA